MFIRPEIISPNPIRQAVAIFGGPTKVAAYLGVSNMTVQNWMVQLRIPKFHQASKLAEATGIDVVDLWGE